MQANEIIATLREYAPELQEAGVLHLSLHGSRARGDNTPISDVDLLAEFDKAKRLTLFSLSGLRLRIVEILGMPVDLADRHLLKEDVKRNAERDALVVF